MLKNTFLHEIKRLQIYGFGFFLVLFLPILFSCSALPEQERVERVELQDEMEADRRRAEERARLHAEEEARRQTIEQ